ncbi:hypothetical protein PVL29_022097 [Vitis rotundifolia]|uniref:Uncharacterized protein n=1 Tax=Vitis rotundifolia TaxID=103349 RepID=A0AA39DAG9_VITRO|nr:hypothetical protein PVL29_022097 [Vitis rotundifolia]
MADRFWSRQYFGLPKRPRSDYDLPYSGLPSGNEVHNYLFQGDDLGGPDLDFRGVGLGTATGEAISGLSIYDPAVMDHLEALDSDLPPSGRGGHFAHQLDAIIRPSRETAPLPPDASSTLYVEELPPDSTRRKVAHIFRPFVRYKEVRLVSKESNAIEDPTRALFEPHAAIHLHPNLCRITFVGPTCRLYMSTPLRASFLHGYPSLFSPRLHLETYFWDLEE